MDHGGPATAPRAASGEAAPCSGGKPVAAPVGDGAWLLRETTRLRGLVKSFSAGSGYGFISCAEARGYYGCDVFLHKKEVHQSGAAPGREVSFGLRLNNQGRPQAWGVQLVEMGGLPCGNAATGPNGSDGICNRIFSGIVKSFNPEKGYGFLKCHETQEAFGRDVFVPRELLANLQCGDLVEFRVALDPKRGFPQARFLKAPHASEESLFGDAPGAGFAPRAAGSAASRSRSVGARMEHASAEEEPRSGWEAYNSRESGEPRVLPPPMDAASISRPPPGLPAGLPPPAPSQPSEPGLEAPAPAPPKNPYGREQFTGVIKSINVERGGFGFIQCSNPIFQRDVWVSPSLTPGFNVGEVVLFRASQCAKRGQPQARSMELASGRGFSADAVPGPVAPEPAWSESRTIVPPRSGHAGPSARAGDWTCGNCGEHVFAKHHSCRKCGMRRPAEDGAGAPEQARAGQSAERAGAAAPQYPPPYPPRPPPRPPLSVGEEEAWPPTRTESSKWLGPEVTGGGAERTAPAAAASEAAAVPVRDYPPDLKAQRAAERQREADERKKQREQSVQAM